MDFTTLALLTSSKARFMRRVARQGLLMRLFDWSELFFSFLIDTGNIECSSYPPQGSPNNSILLVTYSCASWSDKPECQATIGHGGTRAEVKICNAKITGV